MRQPQIRNRGVFFFVGGVRCGGLAGGGGFGSLKQPLCRCMQMYPDHLWHRGYFFASTFPPLSETAPSLDHSKNGWILSVNLQGRSIDDECSGLCGFLSFAMENIVSFSKNTITRTSPRFCGVNCGAVSFSTFRCTCDAPVEARLLPVVCLALLGRVACCSRWATR